MTGPRNPAISLLGRIVLVVSGLGFPLTQAVIVRVGRRGAVVAEGVAVGLLVRDLALVRTGLPARLQPVPRLLLRLELGVATLAALGGLAAVARPAQRVEPSTAGALEAARRFAVGLLFGLHTYQFRIYLGPDRGLEPLPPRLASDTRGQAAARALSRPPRIRSSPYSNSSP